MSIYRCWNWREGRGREGVGHTLQCNKYKEIETEAVGGEKKGSVLCYFGVGSDTISPTLRREGRAGARTMCD